MREKTSRPVARDTQWRKLVSFYPTMPEGDILRYVSRMDVIRSILRMLNKRKEPEGGIVHGENLTQEQADEYLGLLLRNRLVTLEESGLYAIAPRGAVLLEKWDQIDSEIVKGRPEERRPRRRLVEAVPG